MRYLFILTLVACGAEQPPFAQLPLRDSLQAESKALARATVAERDTLRERFVVALGDRSTDEHVVTLDETPAWTRYDEHRLALGQDAAPRIILNGNRVTQIATSYARDARPEPGRLTFDTSRDDPATAGLIEMALHGAAGALVLGLAEGRAIARADHAPFALASDAQTLYVNPAWLVIMAEPLADAEAVTVVSQTSALSIGPVTNYSSCQSDAVAACEQCATDETMCDGRIVLVDFTSSHDECVAIRGSSAVARNVCAKLVMERSEVAQCVQRNEPDCLKGMLPNNAFWTAFYGKSVCSRTIERCAADPNYVVKISCDACGSSCKICNPTFNCNPTCTTPSSSSSSSSCKLCSATNPDPSIPAISIGFALLPLLYFARLMRRRQK